MQWISPEWVADRLERPRRNGSGYIGRCPAHEDSWPSFRVSEGHKGTIMYCHAGCSIDLICAALGIQKEQLFYDAGESPFNETFGALKQLIDRYRPINLWVPETLSDMFIAALETDTLTVEEWVEIRTSTGITHGHLLELPYEKAMDQWARIKVDLLWDYLGLWWIRKNEPKWELVCEFAEQRMRTTWRMRNK